MGCGSGFGWKPIEDNELLQVAPGQDFALVLELPSELGVWPEGTTAYISVNGLTWNAAVSGRELRWWVAAASAGVIPNGTPYRLYLNTPAAVSGYGPATKYLWYLGVVRRTPISGS